MSLSNFIRFLKENQEQTERFCRVAENAVMFYLMFAAIWALCYVVGNIFSWMGVA